MHGLAAGTAQGGLSRGCSRRAVGRALALHLESRPQLGNLLFVRLPLAAARLVEARDLAADVLVDLARLAHHRVQPLQLGVAPLQLGAQLLLRREQRVPLLACCAQPLLQLGTLRLRRVGRLPLDVHLVAQRGHAALQAAQRTTTLVRRARRALQHAELRGDLLRRLARLAELTLELAVERDSLVELELQPLRARLRRV